MAPGRGDYYRGGRGDLFGVIKGIGGTLARGAIGLATGGPLGAIGGIIGGARKPSSTSVAITNPFGLGKMEYHRQVGLGPDDLFRPKRRRMNPANPKALRRALRRVEGFGALAARASADVARANRSLNRIPRKATKKRR